MLLEQSTEPEREFSDCVVRSPKYFTFVVDSAGTSMPCSTFSTDDVFTRKHFTEEFFVEERPKDPINLGR